MRPYDQNNLTRQSADANNAPRDPLLGPITPYQNIQLKKVTIGNINKK